MDYNQLIKRINELANKSKIEELNPEEKKEQQALRQEYIGRIRSNVKTQLDNIDFVYLDEDKTVKN